MKFSILTDSTLANRQGVASRTTLANRSCFADRKFQSLFALGLVASTLGMGCARQKVATVLPKGDSSYEIVAQGPNEETAFRKAEDEANYTCAKQEKQLVVNDQTSVYQGADKESRDDVNGGNVALAYFTGKSGKERKSDDYKVTLAISCS